MYDMFELFRQAQGGAAFDNLARAYGMSPEQMRAAAAALTPAFAQGFQRRAHSDDAGRRFAEMFQTETYARAFEAQAAALDPATRGAGDDALATLFGSKEVSRAVAAQAAAASGVQAQVIREVLPMLASILIGGVMKVVRESQPPGGGAGATGDMFGRMFGGAQAPGVGNPANPFQTWADAFSGGAKSSDAPQGAPNPMGDMMAEFMRSMFGGGERPAAEAAAEPPRKEPAPEPDRAATPSAFDDMMASGREMSQKNAQAMSEIFDAFFGGEKKKG